MSFGLEKSVAQEVVASNSYSDVEAILDFLTNYGQMLKIN
jgi:hypothetical protein